jgi:predicted aspartyl protease
LVNTGFEKDEPEILLPKNLAEKMGLFQPASRSVLQEYEVVGGHVLVIKDARQVGVRILVTNRQTPFVGAFL